MRRMFCLAFAAALAGCQSTAHFESAPAARGVAPGGGTYGGSVEVRSGSGSIAAVLITLGIVSLAVHGEPGSLRMLPWSSTGAPAPMDPDRRVAEQDCTQPVDPAAGNLRCR